MVHERRAGFAKEQFRATESGIGSENENAPTENSEMVAPGWSRKILLTLAAAAQLALFVGSTIVLVVIGSLGFFDEKPRPKQDRETGA